MPASRVSYSGWKNCLRLANDEIELIATLDVGPRIIRFGFTDGQNEFAEYADQIAMAHDGRYHSYGGHRLWVAPETRGWTNHPDNSPVEWKEENDEVVFTACTESGTKLQKQIRLQIETKRNHVRLIHVIMNHDDREIQLAPWSISVMTPGGRLIVPQEPFVAHTEKVLPVRPLVLWGYTEMQDKRWTWGNRYIQLKQDTQSTKPQKFGVLVTQGWSAYVNHDHVFVKKFPYSPNATYPDFGCNAEFYTNHRMLEVESLGPFTVLQPGESISHEENWFLFRGVNVGTLDSEIDVALTSVVKVSTSS